MPRRYLTAKNHHIYTLCALTISERYRNQMRITSKINISRKYNCENIKVRGSYNLIALNWASSKVSGKMLEIVSVGMLSSPPGCVCISTFSSYESSCVPNFVYYRTGYHGHVSSTPCVLSVWFTWCKSSLWIVKLDGWGRKRIKVNNALIFTASMCL